MRDAYQAEPGDLYIQEVSTDHFTLHCYDGRRWHVEGSMSQEEIRRNPAHWCFMGEIECRGKKRQYYRSSQVGNENIWQQTF
jgi:hypothetical protein